MEEVDRMDVLASAGLVERVGLVVSRLWACRRDRWLCCGLLIVVRGWT